MNTLKLKVMGQLGNWGNVCVYDKRANCKRNSSYIGNRYWPLAQLRAKILTSNDLTYVLPCIAVSL